MPDKTVGIIGGLGPMATVCFCELVLSMTDARCDQDNVDMIILNHASIPDRTAFICGLSEHSPLPYMTRDAQKLERSGADFLVMPCNTAHYFFDEIEKSVSIPVLNIVRETVLEAKRRFPTLKKIGILATDGTLQTGTYELVCKSLGLECVQPDAEIQSRVMSLIYDKIKAGQHADAAELEVFFEHMRKKGCECTVLGCTELSVAHRECEISDDDVLDSLEVLALRTVESCGGKIREEYKVR